MNTHRALAWCLCALFARSAVAHADEIEELLQKGVRLYVIADFAGCIKTLSGARRPAAGRNKTLARVHLYLGLSYAELGKANEARSAFTDALSQDPDLSLDPDRYKAGIVQTFRELRAKLTGRLHVTSGRAGERVILDGAVLGKTPFAGPVAIGAHSLEVRTTDGRRALVERVTIVPNQTARVVVPSDRDAATQPSAADRLAPRASEADTAPAPRRRVWTWVAGGGAIAAAVVAIGVGASARSDHDEFMTTNDPARYDELKDTITDKARATNAMWGVAGVLAVTSVALFFVEGRSSGTGDKKRAAARDSVGSIRMLPVVGRTTGAALETRF